MAKKTRAVRYFSENDLTDGVTTAQLRRLGRARQIDYLTYWFGSNYEDPVQSTSYSTAEGGYLWNHGGPYDANEELQAEFGGIVSDKRIQEAVNEIEGDGISEWAGARPDSPEDEEPSAPETDGGSDTYILALQTIIGRLEAGTKPTFGAAAEVQYRQQVIDRLDALSEVLPPTPPAGIGHNNPPPDSEPNEQNVVAMAKRQAETIRQELIKPEPDALAVARATTTFEKVRGWLAKKADLFADSFTKTLGAAAAGAVAVGASTLFGNPATLIHDVIHSAIEWLNLLVI